MGRAQSNQIDLSNSDSPPSKVVLLKKNLAISFVSFQKTPIYKALTKFTLDGDFSKRIDRRITEFIARDTRPFNTVESKGFL